MSLEAHLHSVAIHLCSRYCKIPGSPQDRRDLGNWSPEFHPIAKVLEESLVEMLVDPVSRASLQCCKQRWLQRLTGCRECRDDGVPENDLDWGTWAITGDDPDFKGQGAADTGADFGAAPDLVGSVKYIHAYVCAGQCSLRPVLMQGLD